MTAVRLMQMCGRDNSLEAKCANRRLNRPLLRRRLAIELAKRPAEGMRRVQKE